MDRQTPTYVDVETIRKGSQLIDWSSGSLDNIPLNLQTAPILPLGHNFIPGKHHNLTDKYRVIHIKYCDGTRMYALERFTKSEASTALMAWMVVTEANLVEFPRSGPGASLRLDNGREGEVVVKVAQRRYDPGLEQWMYSTMLEGDMATVDDQDFVSEERLAEKLIPQEDATPTIPQEDAIPTDHSIGADETSSDATQEDSQDHDYDPDSEDVSEGEEETDE